MVATTPGTSERSKTERQYDPALTAKVIGATGPRAHPRLAQILPSLVRHLHDFAREINLNTAELMEAINMINEAGRLSTDRRNETLLLSDIVGLESLVDEITSKQMSASHGTTSSAILGPFYRADSPLLPNGSSILQPLPASTPWLETAEADSAFFTGRVLACGGQPIADALVDVWLTAPNGLYEQQDPQQPDMNLRGRFRTDEHGLYAFYALRPTAYPIPSDGPAGRLLRLLDRQPIRPGHVHFIVSKEGFGTLTTQIFDGRCDFVDNDSVFAVKKDLVVKFVERCGDDKAKWTLEYDFVLGPAAGSE